METETACRVLLLGDRGPFIEEIINLREELPAMRCPNPLPNKPSSTSLSTSRVFTFLTPEIALGIPESGLVSAPPAWILQKDHLAY